MYVYVYVILLFEDTQKGYAMATQDLHTHQLAHTTVGSTQYTQSVGTAIKIQISWSHKSICTAP